MKKLLYLPFLLLSFTLIAVSCSDDNGDSTEAFDDWNSAESPNYKPEGYNPIRGEWEKESAKAGNKRYKYIFTSGYRMQESMYAELLEKWGEAQNIASYKINDKAIKLNEPIDYPNHGKKDILYYRIERENSETVLYIKNPIEEVKYYRLK